MQNLIKILLLIVLGSILLTSPIGAAEKSEIVFGYSSCISGAMGNVGEMIRQGYTIWAEMVNAKGGIYVKEFEKRLPVKLVMYDDKSDPTTAAKIYERLITVDKVDFVLGPYGSSICFPVSGICQKYKAPMVFVHAGSDPIYKQGFDYAFCTIEPCSRGIWTAIRGLRDKKLIADPPKKLFFVAAKELYNITLTKGGIELAKELGFETYYEEVEKGVKDFTAVITRAKNSGFDGMIGALYPADFFLLYKQMLELGYRPKYFNGVHGTALLEFGDTFGKASEGVFAAGYYAAGWPTFENKEFVERYQKKYNELPTHYGAGSASGQIMQQAIEKAGTLNPEKVKEVLVKEEFKSWMQPRVKYANEGGFTNVNKLAFTGILQWQNGKLLTVYPPELSAAKMIYPMPWGK